MKYCGKGNFAETDLICFQVPNVKYQRLLHHSVPMCPFSRWWREQYFLQSITTFGILEALRVYFLGKEGKMLTVWIIAANVIYIGGQRAGWWIKASMCPNMMTHKKWSCTWKCHTRRQYETQLNNSSLKVVEIEDIERQNKIKEIKFVVIYRALQSRFLWSARVNDAKPIQTTTGKVEPNRPS